MRISTCTVAVLIALGSSTSWAVAPNVSSAVVEAQNTIYQDEKIQEIFKELSSPESAKDRFNTHMELVRIASPSREEHRRSAEIHKRLKSQWGFEDKDIMTQADGFLKGAGIQTVDGKPVYNVCVRIPGTYSQSKDSKHYKGQYPKVLIEGHIDTVNPAALPPKETPYVPIYLQKYSEQPIKSPQELASLKDKLSFDKNGKIIEDDLYKQASKRYDSEAEAKKQNAYRIYVPGFGDAMGNTTNVFYMASMLKKHNVKPVYDIWFCGTAGEEGKGNLAGMKQLYGYNQDTGKGNNALNFVANYGIDSTNIATATTANYLGSYRFEIKYSEPDTKEQNRPSALMAMSKAIDKIAMVKTPWDADHKAEKTTYTVGIADCETTKAKGERSKNCTLMVDMRSATQGPLSKVRSQIEPAFKAALDEENSKFGLKAGDKNAVSMKLVWFGDRPAYQRANYDDAVMQAYWQSARTVGIDIQKNVYEDAASVNDNVPAAIGVPTVNFNGHVPAITKGGHAFWEWGISGNAQDEAKRMLRAIIMGLTTAGFNTSDGTVVQPTVAPIGARTTEEIYK